MKKLTLLFVIVLTTFVWLPSVAEAGMMKHPDQMFNCKAVEVLVFKSRIHVKCSNVSKMGPHNIRYISVGTSDVQTANRFINLGTAAVVSGHIFRTRISGDPEQCPSGCQPTDCRKAITFGISR